MFLPPFAQWMPVNWQNLDKSYQEITDNMLGWDVTDFGSGDFKRYGLVAFTFRNGNYKESEKYPKPYCEKVLLLNEGQELPYHFHRLKEEDTINRGGGNLKITVWNSTEDEALDEEKPVHIVKDGHKLVLDPGTIVTLHPGRVLRLPLAFITNGMSNPTLVRLWFGRFLLLMMTTLIIAF